MTGPVSEQTAAKPFLRWVGGKQQLVARLSRCLPDDVARLRYVEPFVGAGSMFFAIAPSRAAISDLNAHLINCYLAIRAEPELVSRYLRGHQLRSDRAYYYAQRDVYNRCSSKHSVAQAARFIYLNQSCFNGVFRVNKRGEYNVPFGAKSTLAIPTLDQLRGVASRLKGVQVECRGYEDALRSATSGDFVYLDPPYPPLNGTAYFTHYTKDRFGEDDQATLAAMIVDASANGAKVMVSNADTPLIRSLYRGFHIKPLQVTRYVSCKKQRRAVGEVVITNYDLCEAGEGATSRD